MSDVTFYFCPSAKRAEEAEGYFPVIYYFLFSKSWERANVLMFTQTLGEPRLGVGWALESNRRKYPERRERRAGFFCSKRSQILTNR